MPLQPRNGNLGWPRSAAAVVIGTLLLLAACRTPPAPENQREPTGSTVTAVVPGSVLYSVDSAASQVLVLVYREGPMAALGHNHVMNLRGLTGSVQLHEVTERSRFALQFAPTDIAVDEPALRATAGADFVGNVNDAAREGTRNNMLGEKLLQAAGFPRITLNADRVDVAADGSLVVTTRINVRGQNYHIRVPLRLQRGASDLTASGEFTLRQSELGLTPFSVMMGALRVSDAMQVRFRIVAHRVML
jgi:hypothetical protein